MMKKNQVSVKEERLVNLRRDSHRPGQMWRVAGQPRKVFEGDARPIGSFRLDGLSAKVTLFMRPASTLCALRGSWEGGDVQQIGLLEGEPTGIASSGGGIVVLLMRHGPAVYLTYTSAGVFTLHGPMPALPPLAIMPEGEALLTEAFADCPLSGASTVAAGLTEADTALLSANAVAAYRRLMRRAACGGFFLQPVLARYRLADPAGQTLACSPPVMLCHSTGFQGCTSLTAASSDGLHTISSGALTAGVYVPQLVVPEGMPQVWTRVAAKLVVELTPLIDPVDPDALCPVGLRDNGTGQIVVTFRLPGTSATLAAEPSLQASRVEETLRNSARLFCPVAEIAMPFASPGTVDLSGPLSLRLGAMPPDVAPLPAPSPTPHYGLFQPLGDLVFAASPRHQPEGVVSPWQLVTKTAPGSYRGHVAATMGATGETLVAVGGSSDAASRPAALSPLVCVPFAEARQGEIAVETSEGTLRQEFELKRCGRWAYWLHPSLAPWMPPTTPTAYVRPPSTVAPTVAPGRVDLFAAGNLSAPVGRIDTEGEARAFAEVPRAQGAWDFARRKVMVMGSFGILMANIDASGRVRSVALLDPRPVAGQEAVCVGCNRSGAVVAAIAGGDLVELTSRKAATLMGGCRAGAVGYCAAMNEYWLLSPTGGTASPVPPFEADAPLRRLTAAGDLVEARFPAFASATGTVADGEGGGRLLLRTPSGLFDTSREDFPVGLRIAHTLCMSRCDYRPLQPRGLTLRAFGTGVRGSLLLEGHNGSGVGAPLARFSLLGSLNAPFSASLRVPARYFLSLTLEAEVAADFCFLPPEIQ